MQRRRFLHLLSASGPLAWLAGRLGAAGSPDYQKMRAALAGRKLFVVPYSHIDWAWTHSREWQAERAALSLSEALDLIKTIPDYRFFVDTWNEFVEPFVDRHPDRLGDFRRAVESGHLAVCGGTVADQHPMWMSQEALIRNMVLGRRLFRNLVPGFRASVMVLYDVTPGSSQMPQILQKAGYFAFRTDRPDKAMTDEGVPRNFVWRGLDGSEVLVSRGGYTGLRSSRSLGEFRTNWEQAAVTFYQTEIARMAEPRGGDLIWIPMGSDDVRPMRTPPPLGDGQDGLIPLEEFERKWNQHEEAKLAFATPVEYFRTMQKEAASLPRHQGVLEPTMWTFLYGADGNQGLRLWRARAEQALVGAERFLSCCTSLGESYPASQLENLWHDLLRAYSHAQTVLFARDYAAHLDLVKKTYYAADDLRGHALQKIASRVHVKPERPCVLLFNNLPWERTEVVEIWITMPPGGASNVVVRDAHGETLPHQVIDANYYRRETIGGPFKEVILLVEARVPAMGYATVYADPVEGTLELPVTSSSENSLDTAFASVEWSSQGVEYLLDKATGARYPGLGNVVFRAYRTIADFRPGPQTETLRWTGVQLEKVVRGPLRSSFTLKGPLGPHAVRLTGNLYPRACRIAFQTEIQTPGGSGSFSTIAGLPGPGQFSADVHFGVEARDLSKVVYEPGGERAFKNVFYGGHWADYSNGRYGLAVLATTGEKGFQFFPGENVLEHFLLKLIPSDDMTWWRYTTPAAQAIGTHDFDYQFLLHPGDWKSGDVVRRAMEARNPILAVQRDHSLAPGGQILPEENSFVKLSPPSIQLSAFYRQDDRYIARVYECSGARGRARLELPMNVTHVREINFHGEPRGKAITAGNRSVEFDVSPWEVVTVEIS